MRTLSEITSAVRMNEPVSHEELRYAICAYDVVFAHLHVENDPEQLAEYFQAGSMDPKEYIGWANDFENDEFKQWYKTMNSIEERLQSD